MLFGVLSGAFSVSAASLEGAESNNELLGNSIMKIQDEDLIKTVKPYITTDNYKFKLTNIDEMKSKIFKSDFTNVKEQISRVNQTLQKKKGDKHLKKVMIKPLRTLFLMRK